MSTEVARPAVYSTVLSQFKPQLQYPYDFVIAVATSCLTDGNRARVCRRHGLPEATLKDWQEKDFWEPLADEIRGLHRAELDAAFTGIVVGSLEAVRDRIESGDEVIAKDGSKQRVKVRALDAMKINSIAFDKRQLLRRQPTQIRDNAELGTAAAALIDTLAKLRGTTVNGTVREIIDVDDV